MIYFLDFEASSLMKGSFPIEIAWVDQTGQAESYLVRPAPEWLTLDAGRPEWSLESERLHGIPFATILSDGVDHGRVARRTEEVLGRLQAMAFSDNPQSDGHWLDMLLRAGKVRRSVPVTDVRLLYGWACRPLRDLLPLGDGPGRDRAEQRVRNLAAEIVARAEEAESLRPRVHHRAVLDAESLWHTWVAVQTGVAEWLAKERGQ